jgi:hypothetical protein
MFSQKRQNMGKITASEVLMGRHIAHPLSQDLKLNLDGLLNALNALRRAYGKPMRVTSGYRPAPFNKAAGGTKLSNHMVCLACDFADPDGALDAWCMANLHELEKAGLWLEHPDATPGWCHLQAVPPRSGNRVFRP